MPFVIWLSLRPRGPALPTVKRPAALPPELQFLLLKEQTEKTLSDFSFLLNNVYTVARMSLIRLYKAGQQWEIKT